MKKEVVLVFQKNEVLGKVKTRLAPGMGELRALEIYRHLTQSTYSVLEDMSAPVWTYFSDFIPETVNPPIAKSFVQDGQDLGERMAHAFARSFESGMEKVVLIGTDCPTLQSHHLHEAFEAFCDHSKAKRLLNFKDETEIRSTTKEMLEWAIGQPERTVLNMRYEINKGIYSYWK